ncbi:FtsW/RodA/SpoVE family cell cycle protein [Metabacillus indicus]|uniref:FtsW/RodA/SpoVE family cell cycle protein n=1 Tax=Metabacillus indicus TaxID=246786 RepID=UPI003175B25F
MRETRDSYLSKVKEQIKSREASTMVEMELNAHIESIKEDLVKKGLTADEAEKKAIAQMGNPARIGKDMNKIHRAKTDWVLILLFTLCMGAGFLPVFIGEPVMLVKKIVISTAGAITVFIFMMVDFRRFEKGGWVFYILGAGFLLVIPAFANGFVNGSLTIQLSYFTFESLISIPFLLVGWAFFLNNNSLKVWHAIILYIVPIMLFAQLPAVSTAVLYTVMVCAMICFSKFSKKVILSLLTAGSVLAGLFLFFVFFFSSLERKTRLDAFLNPEKYSNDAGFPILYIRGLIQDAGWFGQPLNKMQFEDSLTNLVFVSITASFGWMVAGAIVILLFLFIFRLAFYVPKMKHSFGRLLLAGAISLFAMQVAVNIGMALGLLPLMTMSLPFISYGLMPVLLNSVLTGIVLSIYRRKDLLGFESR